MVRRQISESQRWQIIGMHTTGMSFKAIGRQMGFHYAVVSRLVRKHTQTNNVKYLSRPGRPRVTSDRENRALQRLVRRMPFSTSPVLKQHWLPNRRLSTRTARNSLKSSELKSNLFHQIQLFVSDTVFHQIQMYVSDTMSRQIQLHASDTVFQQIQLFVSDTVFRQMQ
jgi:IS30 family transposase